MARSTARRTRDVSQVSKATEQEFRRASKRLRTYAKVISRDLNVHGLYVIGEEIMADIKDAVPGKGVPVDEGPLRDSGRVNRLGPLGGVNAAVELAFGGASAPYALIQHETLHYRHTVGEARYLVRGVERWNPRASGAMADVERRTKHNGRRIGRGEMDV